MNYSTRKGSELDDEKSSSFEMQVLMLILQMLKE